MWNLRLCFAMVCSGVGVAMGGGALGVQNLRCELQVDPVAIQTKQPRLSWQITSDLRDVTQTGYQILVATQREKLSDGAADLWNSGRVNAQSSLLVPYAGKGLASNQRAFWCVKAWDNKGNASDWSAPAEFTMGLLPDDMKARWIGTGTDEERVTAPIEMAKWLWSPEEIDKLDQGAGKDAPAAGAERDFRKVVKLPSAFKNAQAQFTVDNVGELRINGQRVASGKEWTIVTAVDVSKYVRPGEDNTIVMHVKNGGSSANAAGFAFALAGIDETGSTFTLTSDETWECRHVAGETRGDWGPVRVLGGWNTAPWTKVTMGTHPTLPIFRKEFALEKPVARALAHVCGLGQFVLHVNGKKVGDHFLDPDWSVYEKTAYYNTFDVTKDLAQANAIGVMMGKGFYSTSGDRRIHGVNADRPLALWLQVDVEFEDGTTTRIISDESWRWTPGPLTHNSILGGSSYDARQWPEGWTKPGFDASGWSTAAPGRAPGGTLTASAAPPMRKMQEFEPKTIEEPKRGRFVYDFGQNCSAAPRLRVKGPRGAEVKLVWAEQREGQSPFTNNGKGVVDQSGIGKGGYCTYTLRGDEGGEEWFSELFYTGYQYMEVTGAVPAGHANPEGLPVVEKLTSVHVRSDQPDVGTFATSNEMFNRIDTMISWAVRSNLGHVFTDCPTREKLGWLEVPWLMWASVASRYEMTAYAEKIARDIHDSQLPTGEILTVAPAYPKFSGGFRYTAEWGAAGVFIPWYNYEWYDDVRALEQNYDMMRAYVDFLEKTSDNLVAAPGLGDWYDYWPDKPLGPSQFTPTELSATAVFAGCADAVSSSAKVLGKAADQEKYAALAGRIRQAFNAKFRTGPGQYKNFGSPQTAHAMALVFNMVPAGERVACAQAIVDDLREREWQQTSGDVGYRFLINALADTGHSDVIFKILSREKIGSYAYLVNSGWTSLPEAWNASPTSSMNHCMLGHIQEWFTQHLLGIAPAAGSVGFDRIAIQPTPGEGVTSASGTLETPRGRVELAWEQRDGGFDCRVVIPANSVAEVALPVPAGAEISEGGKVLAAEATGATPADGGDVRRVGRSGDRERVKVGSGRYEFQVRW